MQLYFDLIVLYDHHHAAISHFEPNLSAFPLIFSYTSSTNTRLAPQGLSQICLSVRQLQYKWLVGHCFVAQPEIFIFQVVPSNQL